MIRCALGWVIGLALWPAALMADRFEPGEDEIRFARALLNKYQSPSFRHDAEYCGYILRDAEGRLFSTPASRGESATCAIPTPKQRGRIHASWHTHAAFNPDAFSEVPSALDLEGDINAGVHGWVATPGGRLWLVDHLAEEVRLICGPSCLKTDPMHVFGFEGKIPARIGREELEHWGD